MEWNRLLLPDLRRISVPQNMETGLQHAADDETGKRGGRAVFRTPVPTRQNSLLIHVGSETD